MHDILPDLPTDVADAVSAIVDDLGDYALRWTWTIFCWRRACCCAECERGAELVGIVIGGRPT